MINYIKLLRIDHWVKNIFIIPGIVFATLISSKNDNLIYAFILSFIVCGLAASANYVINEYLDRHTDKYHPIKSNRTSVKHQLNAHIILTIYTLLSITSLSLASQINNNLLITIIFFLFMGFLYNVNPFRLKDKVYLDVLSESVNNPIRFCIGYYLIIPNGIPPISILLAYWMGGGFLMAMKRYNEFISIKDKNSLGLYRKSFLSYTNESLLISSLFYMSNSCLFLGVFLIKYKVEYILLFPLISILYCYYFYISTHTNSNAQKPENLYKEKKLVILIALIIILFILLTNTEINFLNQFTYNAKYIE